MASSHQATQVLNECKLRSNDGIERMRKAALDRFGDASEFLIGVSGSYARREATVGSDVDLFFLAEGEVPLTRESQGVFRDLLSTDFNMRLPAKGGVFDDVLPVEKILDIGGLTDNNVTLTRRMLLLLEGEWVFNERKFDQVRSRLLEKYLYYRPEREKICMFLLNDIIRYWRTICIDLEHKTYADGKAREIRLIKLRFSRMLLYASGVLAIGEGYGLSWKEKIDSLRMLFAKYPIDRIRSIVGEEAVRMLDLYAGFLRRLNTPSIRRALEEDGRTQVFDDMSTDARKFRNALYNLFEGHFGDGNPTIRALLL